MECNLCSKPVPENSQDEDSHVECDEEWQRRIREKICTICGEKDAIKETWCGYWCADCGMDAPYKGYENCYSG